MKPKLKPKLSLILLMLLLAGLLVACGNDNTPFPAADNSQSGNLIRIYSSLPLTGSDKKQNETMVNAMKMALEDVTNKTNRIGQFTVEYQPLDDSNPALGQWDEKQEAANATRAVSDPDAMVYIGTFNSGAAKISIPITNRAALAMISPANEYSGLTRSAEGVTAQGEPGIYYPGGGRNFFRVITADDVQAPATVAFIISTFKPKSMYVIDDSQLYGKGLADSFAIAATKAGITNLTRASISGKENGDYQALIAGMKSKTPDVIYFGGITAQQPGKMLAEIRKAGIKATFVSGSGIVDDGFIKDAGRDAEGTFAILSGVDDTQLPTRGQDFLKRYKARFNEDPQPFTIYAYEAMSVALNAIKSANKKDRLEILRSIAGTKNFDGVLGKWNFDQNGDISINEFKVLQVKDAKWSYLTQTRPNK